MRNEFTKPVKRSALKRSGGQCEARGTLYGLPEGKRCGASLAHGVIFDHEDPDANSKDNSLTNCVCICLPCNRHKTYKRDIPMLAKTQRQKDKNAGIRRRSPRPMPGSRASKWKRKMSGEIVAR